MTKPTRGKHPNSKANLIHEGVAPQRHNEPKSKLVRFKLTPTDYAAVMALLKPLNIDSPRALFESLSDGAVSLSPISK